MENNLTIKGRVIEQMDDNEFFHFCQENSGLKFERDTKGQIVIMSPTAILSGDRNSEINYQLRAWNKREKRGRVVDSDTGFYLKNGAMRNPDAAWIRNQQFSQLAENEINRSFAHICPDFIIELKSYSDSIEALKGKMNEWIENGCKLGWLMDVDNEVVYIYEQGKPERTHKGFDSTLSGDPILPGFEFELAELRF
ncbi:MAG: Uma2 family endonuclease [Cyclobacteriaceae bacterium]|jgi:Uma2 family endonuclease|nr:Uma2 family endonuclease [Flammeovirgaceae bacterium]